MCKSVSTKLPMANMIEEPIIVWIKQGELSKLEQALLDGYGDHLAGKSSSIPQVDRFLKQVPSIQAKIDEIHRAVTLGKLRNVQHLIDRKKLAFCRDQMGATPLHKAVIYGQKEIIHYLLERFGSVVHARDHRGRTPLHYAAVLRDSQELYKLLIEAGADDMATDMFGKRPQDYLQHQDGMSAQVLRESAIIAKPFTQRMSRKSASRLIDPQSWTMINSSKSIMHRTNIRELIKQGKITTLEEIVFQGYGDRLLGETSSIPMVQDFLDRVPSLLDQIIELHKTACKGNLNEFKSLVNHKGIILARDQIGFTPLHKATLYGHTELVDFIASNHPETLDARDHDKRTALHYAAALPDDRLTYTTLVKRGASPLLSDYKGKSCEYYLRYPEEINLQQIIKRSLRLNANYAITTANRIKSKSPSRKRDWSPSYRQMNHELMVSKSEPMLVVNEEQNVKPDNIEVPIIRVVSTPNIESSPSRQRSRASTPAMKFKVTSALLQTFLEDGDLDSIEAAVIEGHGETIKSKAESIANANVQHYLEHNLPKIINKIRMIHVAVSCGDLHGLEHYLDKKEYALAKDQFGLSPLHKATIFGHEDVVQYLLDNFPETVHSKDREGRTALHYAAAANNKVGARIFKMLLRNGADLKARDMYQRTADFYRVHLIQLPSEISKQISKRHCEISNEGAIRMKRRSSILPNVREQITTALQEGDVSKLHGLTLEGYGKGLVGRSVWTDKARKYLKRLPQILESIKGFHSAILNGDVKKVESSLESDPSLIKAKDEYGLMAIHSAALRNQPEIVFFIINKFPNSIHFKDNFGRTVLHIAAQKKASEMYHKLIDYGADPTFEDDKGRTPDYYFKSKSAADHYSYFEGEYQFNHKDGFNETDNSEEELAKFENDERAINAQLNLQSAKEVSQAVNSDSNELEIRVKDKSTERSKGKILNQSKESKTQVKDTKASERHKSEEMKIPEVIDKSGENNISVTRTKQSVQNSIETRIDYEVNKDQKDEKKDKHVVNKEDFKKSQNVNKKEGFKKSHLSRQLATKKEIDANVNERMTTSIEVNKNESVKNTKLETKAENKELETKKQARTRSFKEKIQEDDKVNVKEVVSEKDANKRLRKSISSNVDQRHKEMDNKRQKQKEEIKKKNVKLVRKVEVKKVKDQVVHALVDKENDIGKPIEPVQEESYDNQKPSESIMLDNLKDEGMVDEDELKSDYQFDIKFDDHITSSDNNQDLESYTIETSSEIDKKDEINSQSLDEDKVITSEDTNQNDQSEFSISKLENNMAESISYNQSEYEEMKESKLGEQLSIKDTDNYDNPTDSSIRDHVLQFNEDFKSEQNESNVISSPSKDFKIDETSKASIEDEKSEELPSYHDVSESSKKSMTIDVPLDISLQSREAKCEEVKKELDKEEVKLSNESLIKKSDDHGTIKTEPPEITSESKLTLSSNVLKTDIKEFAEGSVLKMEDEDKTKEKTHTKPKIKMTIPSVSKVNKGKDETEMKVKPSSSDEVGDEGCFLFRTKNGSHKVSSKDENDNVRKEPKQRMKGKSCSINICNTPTVRRDGKKDSKDQSKIEVKDKKMKVKPIIKLDDQETKAKGFFLGSLVSKSKNSSKVDVEKVKKAHKSSVTQPNVSLSTKTLQVPKSSVIKLPSKSDKEPKEAKEPKEQKDFNFNFFSSKMCFPKFNNQKDDKKHETHEQEKKLSKKTEVTKWEKKWTSIKDLNDSFDDDESNNRERQNILNPNQTPPSSQKMEMKDKNVNKNLTLKCSSDKNVKLNLQKREAKPNIKINKSKNEASSEPLDSLAQQTSVKVVKKHSQETSVKSLVGEDKATLHHQVNKNEDEKTTQSLIKSAHDTMNNQEKWEEVFNPLKSLGHSTIIPNENETKHSDNEQKLSDRSSVKHDQAKSSQNIFQSGLNAVQNVTKNIYSAAESEVKAFLNGVSNIGNVQRSSSEEQIPSTTNENSEEMNINNDTDLFLGKDNDKQSSKDNLDINTTQLTKNEVIEASKEMVVDEENMEAKNASLIMKKNSVKNNQDSWSTYRQSIDFDLKDNDDNSAIGHSTTEYTQKKSSRLSQNKKQFSLDESILTQSCEPKIESTPSLKETKGDKLNELIGTWLKNGDIVRLEHVVIAGQGKRLLDKTSSIESVQEFLDLVPAYLLKIKTIHDTVVRGNFNEVRQVLTRKRFALSRDHVGASPLHLAVLHGHIDVLLYIISEFPETIDGPDNDGRTPLHYAAVVYHKDDQYYKIIKKAGANESLKDKFGHSPEYYIQHPKELTIGDLLSNYKKTLVFDNKFPKTVDKWQRPPTADIESRLTPSPMSSVIDEEEFIENNSTTHRVSVDVHVGASGADNEREMFVFSEHSLTEEEEEEAKKEIETFSEQFKESLQKEKGRLQESINKMMGPDLASETMNGDVIGSSQESSESSYELSQVKDEEGRTILHLAASKWQKPAILYQMLASTEYLIGERDEKYQTVRDVAINTGYKANAQVIDNYILDAFQKNNISFIKMLSHHGYDFSNITDSNGTDIMSLFEKQKDKSMINLLQDVIHFQKQRQELHTYIKNDYLQGVDNLIESNNNLVIAKNKRSRTSLHLAVLFGNLEIIQHLIQINPNVINIQDNLGRTALHYAMGTTKVEEIGKIFDNKNASRMMRDVKMRSPSYYFVYHDEIQAIKKEEKSLN